MLYKESKIARVLTGSGGTTSGAVFALVVNEHTLRELDTRKISR